jgi:hypothetical protein
VNFSFFSLIEKVAAISRSFEVIKWDLPKFELDVQTSHALLVPIPFSSELSFSSNSFNPSIIPLIIDSLAFPLILESFELSSYISFSSSDWDQLPEKLSGGFPCENWFDSDDTSSFSHA